MFPNYICGSECLQGDSGMKSTILPVCKSCSVECSECTETECQSCTLGYYLSDTLNSCVLASNCKATYIANQDTRTCTQCGNGVFNVATEECDDNNLVGGDGCTLCKIDAGYSCINSNPSVCIHKCGDGIIQTPEQCDDGNYIQYDGCFACRVEGGFDCGGTPTTCTRLCGNGRRTGTEQCDDNNVVEGDGCSSLCVV